MWQGNQQQQIILVFGGLCLAATVAVSLPNPYHLVNKFKPNLKLNKIKNLLSRIPRIGGTKVGKPLVREGRCIYLDYAATCPIYPEVTKAMIPYLQRYWGNPSSGHVYGVKAANGVARARLEIAKLLDADISEIIFCSCGSEVDNWAITGALQNERNHVITTAIEHPAILACTDHLQAIGIANISIIGCDDLGRVSPQTIADAVIPGKTAIVSVMLANNEIGAIQDITTIVRLVKAKDPQILVHTDAAQAIGKIPVNVQNLGVDLLTLVGHKIGAPKGCAVLYIRKGVNLTKFLHGGGQEFNRRAGTESVPLIVAMGEAARIWNQEGIQIAQHSTRMRDRLAARLRDLLSPSGLPLRVNGPLAAGLFDAALPNVLSIAVGGISASSILATLREDLAASAAAACHSDSVASPVLKAIHLSPSYASGTFRLSVGRHTTQKEIDQAADLLASAILQQVWHSPPPLKPKSKVQQP